MEFNSSCSVPTHTEMVNIPHYKDTMHSQMHVNNWVDHAVQYRQVPVTSEVQTVQHPTTSSCNSGCGYGGNYGVNYGCCNPRIGYW
jgi:hypothetical protein